MSIISEKKEGCDKGEHPSIEFVEDNTDISDVRVIDIPALIIFWSLAAIVFLQFFTRYVLNDSLAWTEEIARYVLIWVAFSGALAVSRKGTHIFIEFFYRYIPVRSGKVVSIAVEIICLCFWGWMTWVGIKLALSTKTKMASAEIPKSILYWGVAVCLAGMTAYSLYWIIKKIRSKPSEIVPGADEHPIHQQGN